MEIGNMQLHCYCGYPSRRWTATTRRNYGRRFLGCCRGKQMGHCEFFVWLDPPIPSPMTQDRESELVLAQERERKMWIVVALEEYPDKTFANVSAEKCWQIE
ncbi:hypothetical protein M0R45_037809 [Rubus argutus]|uniref:GRF-type domain-containing protein n=1 Tax=Rubus argutus TaxID=59490 RepID=A0AAW1W1D7_RUBAR